MRLNPGTILMKDNNLNRGYLLMLVLVFGAIFFTIISSFIVFSVTQSKLISQKFEQESAGQIAEAGINYYKWYLAHNPNDFTNGTGLPGPYVGVYNDPEGAAIGEYSLSIASTTSCGDISSILITSVGKTYKEPKVKRTVSARYTRPTVADYSYILNSNVWVGASTTITGPYYSNGGIRFDGSNNSTVKSGQSSWTCDSNYGCSPTVTKNGVFTTASSANQALFSYPSSPINFSGITVDLTNMETKSKTGGGLYFGPSGKSGYYVIMNADGTVTVNVVKGKQNEPNGYAWGQQMNILNSTTLLGTYTPSASCPLMFFEDQVWLEGTLKGKLTLVAADVDTSGVDPSIILNNNINYADASSGLLAIGEYDVLVGLVVPDNMTLNGIFMAQTGHFGRNDYDSSLPSSWEQYILRNSLTMNGTVVSNGRTGTKWVDGNGNTTSGFINRFNTYDRSLVASPPPMVPKTSDIYQFSDWSDSN